MSAYDPGVVIQALDDLCDELDRWTGVASAVLRDSELERALVEESVEQAWHRAFITQDEVERNGDDLDSTESALVTLLDRCNDAVVSATQTTAQAENARLTAQETVELWESELTRALAWLDHAHTRLEQAIAAYEAAYADYSRAVDSLNAAIGRLNSCRNRRNANCWGEEMAVSSGRQAVSAAEARVHAAEVEMDAARDEVARAEARVACCEQSLDYGRQALLLADEAVLDSQESAASAEKGLEYAHLAERLLYDARGYHQRQKDAAQAMMTSVRDAQSHVEDALDLIQRAGEFYDDGRRYCTDVNVDLAYRRDRLYHLNRPSLDGSVPS